MNIFKNERSSIGILIVIYTISNAFFLLNYNGIYWDDWAFYEQDVKTIEALYYQLSGIAGYPLAAITSTFVNMENGIFLQRILAFLLLLLSSVFIYKIIKNIISISDKERFFLVLFFSIAPLYSAKILLVDFPYTFFSTIFFFSFYLLSRNIKKIKLIKRLLILFLFFTSFQTNSLLVFYAIPLMYLYVMKYYTNVQELRGTIVLFLKGHFDFIFLPVLYFIIRSYFFSPSGIYTNYNGPSLKNILLIPIKFIKTIYTSFLDPLSSALYIAAPSFTVILLFCVFFIFYRSKSLDINDKVQSKYIKFFLLGVFLFFLGALPYLVVGKVPKLLSWDSRHQLLLPLGFSFMLYFGIKAIIEHLEIKKAIISSVILWGIAFSFVLFQLNYGVRYNIDYLYQQSIIENLKQHEAIKENSTFVVNVDLNDKFANRRRLPYYELNGLSKQAFGIDNKLFVTNESQIKEHKKAKKHKQYNFSTWEEDAPFIFTIEENPKDKKRFNKDYLHSIKNLLILKYLNLFDYEKFKIEIRKLVIFSVPMD